MTAPYTQPTLSGYNASPPADDGSAVSTNALKWANHIEKIGDPIKTFSQAIDANLVTAFGKIFGTTIVTKSGNYVVLASNQGDFIEVTAAATITLIAAATAGENFPLAIINTGSGVVTVDGNASETINGSPTVTLDPGQAMILTCDGSKWIAVVTASRVLTGYQVAHKTISSASGVLTLNLSLANSFDTTLTENITSIVVTNFATSGTRSEFELVIDQDLSTPFTVAWAAKYRFPNGSDHVMSTGSGARDIVQGLTFDGDTVWDCSFRKDSA